MIPEPQKGQYLNYWIPLLTEFELEALKQGGGFRLPYPGMDERHDLYFICQDCKAIHWTRLSVEIVGFGGTLSVEINRHAQEEARVMRAKAGVERLPEDQERIIREQDKQVVRHKCEDLIPEEFAEGFLYSIEKGRRFYLKHILRTGTDDYAYFGVDWKSPEELRILARASLESGGKTGQA